LQLAPGDADHDVARGNVCLVAAAVVLEGVTVPVGEVPVDLEDQVQVGPQEVGPEAADGTVDERLRELGLLAELSQDPLSL